MSHHERNVSFDDAPLSEKYSFDAFMSEKISIEPDLGDQRKSVYKALPAPPTTPKRVLKKYRVAALVPCLLAVASFVLTIVVVLAGQKDGAFRGQYIVAIDLTSFSSSNMGSGPLDSIDNTSAVEMSDRNMYFLYLREVCAGTDGEEGIAIATCESWSEAGDSMLLFAKSLQSPNSTGNSSASTLALARLIESLNSISNRLSHARKVAFAFLVVSLVGSSLSAVSAIPAIFFPKSRLLVHFNMMWPCLASTFAFIAAAILSVVIVGVSSLLATFGESWGITITHGRTSLLFMWLAWLLVALSNSYWVAIWFVEVRRFGLVRRRRDKDEMGTWRDIIREVCKNLKGAPDRSIR